MNHKHKRIRLINTSRQKPDASLKIGEEFEGVVRDLSDTGNGIVEHPNGTVVFVPGLWLGERARLRVSIQKMRFAEAEVVELLHASPQRQPAPCSLHGFSSSQCGGCPWMFMSYAAQLEAKQARATRSLAKLFPKVAIRPILASDKTLGYRVRAQVKTDGERLGFVANGQHQLVDVPSCPVLTDGLQSALLSLRQQLPQDEWRPTGKQPWTTIDLEHQHDRDLFSINQRLPFRQINDGQNHAMRLWLAERLASFPVEAKVVELFAGSGNMTEIVAARGFQQIVAVEAVAEAVAALTAKQLPGVTAQRCDLFNEQQFLDFWLKQQDAEVLLLDPPREGLKIHQGLGRKKSALREILYISCDLATLCRDLAHLQTLGFKLVEAQPIDMFPQTPHLEMMIHLRRRK